MIIHNVSIAQLGKDVCNFRIQYKARKIKKPLENGPAVQRWFRLREIPIFGNGPVQETGWVEINARELANVRPFRRWLKELGGQFVWTGNQKDLCNLHFLLAAHPMKP